MKKRVKQICITLAAVTVLTLTACGGGNKPAANKAKDTTSKDVVKIKFAGVTSDSAKEAAELFKEIAERESKKSLDITLYPDNMLADDRVAIETTQFGDIDIATSSTSPICTMYEDFYMFDAPYLFLSKQEVYDFIDGETGKELLNGMESIGLKGIAFWENGFRNFTNNKIPVSKPADVATMKIRTMENEVHIAAWKALGANPTPMAFTEVFTALQQGTIDGQENPLGIINANKFQEVQKYVSLTQHVYTPYVIAMNLDKWNSLTKEQQTAIETAAKESTTFQRERSEEIEQEIITSFKDQGVTVLDLNADEKAAFQKIIMDNDIFSLVTKKMKNPKYLEEALKK